MNEATSGAPGAGCAERSSWTASPRSGLRIPKQDAAYLRAEIEALLQRGVYTILAVLEFLLITARCVSAPRYRYAKRISYLPDCPTGFVARFPTGVCRAPSAPRRTKAANRSSTRLGCWPEKYEGMHKR
jgi:hypothetical protein